MLVSGANGAPAQQNTLRESAATLGENRQEICEPESLLQDGCDTRERKESTHLPKKRLDSDPERCCNLEHNILYLLMRLARLSGGQLTTRQRLERSFILKRLRSEAGYMLAMAFFLIWTAIYFAIVITASSLMNNFTVNEALECSLLQDRCTGDEDCIALTVSMLLLGICGTFMFAFLTCMSCGLREVVSEHAFSQFHQKLDTRQGTRARRRATAGSTASSLWRVQVGGANSSEDERERENLFDQHDTLRDEASPYETPPTMSDHEQDSPTQGQVELVLLNDVHSPESGRPEETDDQPLGMRTISRQTSNATLTDDEDGAESDIERLQSSHNFGDASTKSSATQLFHQNSQETQHNSDKSIQSTSLNGNHNVSNDYETHVEMPEPLHTLTTAPSQDIRATSSDHSPLVSPGMTATLSEPRDSSAFERRFSSSKLSRRFSKRRDSRAMADIDSEDEDEGEVDPIQFEEPLAFHADPENQFVFRPFAKCNCVRSIQCCTNRCPNLYIDPTEFAIHLGRRRRFDTYCMVSWTQIGAQCCTFPWLVLILTATITVVSRTKPGDFSTYEGLCAVNSTLESNLTQSQEHQREIHNRAVALTWFAVLFTWAVLSAFGINALTKTAIKKYHEAKLPSNLGFNFNLS